MIAQAFDWTWAWIIAGAIIAGLEIVIPGIFLLWIGLGAVATGLVLARYPDLALEWQFLVFAVSMVSSVGIGFWIQRRSGRTKQARLMNREMKAMIGKTYVASAPSPSGAAASRCRTAATPPSVTRTSPPATPSGSSPSRTAAPRSSRPPRPPPERQSQPVPDF
jgi:inner membrane protein